MNTNIHTAKNSIQLSRAAVVVTGGSQGLGRALGRALGKAGARVVLVAREPGPLAAAVATIREAGGTAHGISADVADPDAVHRIAGEAVALAGPIDVLVNNASTLGSLPLRLLLDTDCEDLKRVLEVNLVAPFRLIKALAGPMVLRGRGLVINISSDASVEAYERWGAYGVSKAALDHLGRIWAAELAGTGVEVLAVDPGEMNTNMHAAAMPDADPTLLAHPEDVAAYVVSLIAGGGDVVSGTRMSVRFPAPPRTT